MPNIRPVDGNEVRDVRNRTALLWAALAVGALLRLTQVARRSLWMDEFHTFFHARFEGLVPWLEFLRRDNHPPLSFLSVRLSTSLFGDSPLAIRAPAVVFGLWCILHTAKLARGLPRSWAPPLGALLLALSSLHLTATTEARMYALVAVSASGVLLALRDTFDGRPARLRLALWLWVGLHAHYFFLHYATALAAGALAVAFVQRERRAELKRLVPAVLLAGAASLPWYAWGFREQLLGHDLHPGARMDPLRTLPEAVAHLLFHNVSLAGPLRLPILGAAGLALLWALWGLARLLRSPDGRTRALGLLLAAGALGVPAWAAFVSLVFPRSGFNWTYFTGCCAPFALLVTAVPRASRWAGVGVFSIVLAATWLAVCNARSVGTEDYRGAITSILAQARDTDAVFVIEPGFEVFPNALGWKYYAPRLAAPDTPPPRLPLDEDYTLEDPAVLDGYSRAFLMQRGVDDVHPTLRVLREHYAEEHQERYGYSIFVHRFEQPIEGTRR